MISYLENSLISIISFNSNDSFHCYKISFLPNMFDKIIDLLNIYYDIIVTYNIYDEEKRVLDLSLT